MTAEHSVRQHRMASGTFTSSRRWPQQVSGPCLEAFVLGCAIKVAQEVLCSASH